MLATCCRELALVLWAVVAAGSSVSHECFAAIGHTLLERMRRGLPPADQADGGSDSGHTSLQQPLAEVFCPQDVANIVYAYSKSGEGLEGDVANIVYAYSKSGEGVGGRAA
jgi:hypothetical protein